MPSRLDTCPGRHPRPLIRRGSVRPIRGQSRRAVSALCLSVVGIALLSGCQAGAGPGAGGPRFEITFPAEVADSPLDGRVLLVISTDEESEPRFQAGRGLEAQPIFGVDVEGLAPGQPAIIDASTRGYPVESIAQIPAGDYRVQAVLNVYTTFNRADGHTIKAHMDQWEGQHWNRSPGNLMSEPERVHIDPASSAPIRIAMTQKIPPIEPPADTKYVKHIRFRSEMLSKWWGHDIDLGAVVVLPEGFDEHPQAHYPVAYLQGHFPRTFNGFRETPPGADMTGNARDQAASQYRFYQDWVSGKLGRWIIVSMQHPTPFYDDSYAVNSQNNGPYGDALTQELIPRVESQFRAIGEPWARTVYGGSTGGWESLAWQVYYPDMFNGVWTFCPDPVDFRYFQMVNIYQDTNAFHPNSEWKSSPVRPWMRGVDDQVVMNQMDASHYEQVLGTRGRSGDQMDIFMGVFGPVGDDGYPKLLYDKWTGSIDPSVVDYWKENYDLRYILERDWKTIGPKLVGKLHFYVGEMDTFFLEEAARLMQQFLESTKDPYYAGSFDIGERAPHCYSGAPAFPGQNSHQRVLPLMLDRILKTAPPGADTRSWRY
jgi:Putative esterase